MITTKNIYLDTSAIVQQNFDYASVPFKRLKELSKRGDARLLTTAITQREVESKIKERVREAGVALDRLRNNHVILKNLSDERFQSMFGSIDTDTIEKTLIEQYRDFMQEAGTEVIPLATASADDVFRKYFEREPPFGAGKKKSEFPDAFVMSALENWCLQRGEKAYVVSTDPDVIAHCSGSAHVVHLNRPSEYVDLVLRQNASLKTVEESTSEQNALVEQAIEKEFEQLGFYIDDAEGDVTEVVVEKINIEELSLLDVVDGTATFEVIANVQYTAKVVYDDMETAMWDSEDKVLIPLHTVETEVEGREDIAATMEVELDGKGRFKSISLIKLPADDIAVSVLPDPWEQ